MSGEKPKSTKSPTAEPESKASVLRTLTTAYFCSASKELIIKSLSFSSMICHCMTCIAHFCYALRGTYDALFHQLSVIKHILTNQVLRCWADRGFEKL